jgi:hypothetical protein
MQHCSNFRFGKPEKRAFFVISSDSEKSHTKESIFLAVSMAKAAYSPS